MEQTSGFFVVVGGTSQDGEKSESEISETTVQSAMLEEYDLVSETETTTETNNPFQAPPLNKLYRIVQCISRGSPSSVFIVKAIADGKTYALKKIECHDESDAKKVFYEEMELKKLDHPNISKYKDFFITYEKQRSTVFTNIISQYFQQGNLRNYIKTYQDKNMGMPEQDVKKILGEILVALVYMHDNDYIHRNIKPNNIFQNKKAMVLGDMGVASIMGDLRTNTRQTFQGTVFMAPEIGQQQHNKKSDLYSVGGVLLNLLTTSFLDEQEFYKKLGEIKETPEVLIVILDLISNKYSKPLINTVQMLLRHKDTNRPSTLEFIKSGFVQECIAQADIGQHESVPWQKNVESVNIYNLTENRDHVPTVLKYIADIIEDEDCVADGLSALADILRDNDKAHEFIDQNARSLLFQAMLTNIFNKDIQVAGCIVLSNLVVFAKPHDLLFSTDVISIIHKVMAGHEYSPEVQLAAVDLILAMSSNVKASQTIVQLGGIKDILIAIRHAQYHATLNAMCCLALWSLCSDSENLKIAVKENAAKDVCLALRTHKVSPDVCEAAAAALVSLLLDDSSYDLFCDLDCSGNLIAAINLHTKNQKVVKNCCKVLATAAEANEDCAYRLIASDQDGDDSPSGILTLIKAYKVHKDNADMVESIVKLLLELSLYDDIAAEMEAANIRSLLLTEVYNRYKQNEAIMRPVEKALAKLDAPLSCTGRKSSMTVAIQAPLPNRPYRFSAEVHSSCETMLHKYQKSNKRKFVHLVTTKVQK